MQFISLNSWLDDSVLYQGGSPRELVVGEAGDWERLRRALKDHASHASMRESLHPQGGLVGYFNYDGSYCFGVYPELRTVPRDWQNAAWRERRERAECQPDLGAWCAETPREAFCKQVHRAKDYIAAGDIYQVNLAHRFSCRGQVNPYALFEQLLWRSPAPGGAFLDLGREQLLCSSPELFLKVQGRHVVTRPIKGTRPRDRDGVRDQQLAYELISDPKELAELVMITDLERNDLGRVCEYGSVTVTDLCRLERYAQVFHLVSTVEGWLRPQHDVIDLLSAMLPGGSITGAPKKRAVEIIAELETAPRRWYTGIVGYLAWNGDAAFSILIRTMRRTPDGLEFYVGSGITADSLPEREYEETLHKSQGMRLAVEALREGAQQPVVPSFST